MEGLSLRVRGGQEWQALQPGVPPYGLQDQKVLDCAREGNRTRASRAADENSATEPPCCAHTCYLTPHSLCDWTGPGGLRAVTPAPAGRPWRVEQPGALPSGLRAPLSRWVWLCSPAGQGLSHAGSHGAVGLRPRGGGCGGLGVLEAPGLGAEVVEGWKEGTAGPGPSELGSDGRASWCGRLV